MASRKNSRFSLKFVLFFPRRLKTIENFLLLTPKVLTSFTFLPKKMLIKKIEALLQSLNVMTDKKKTHIILKSIHLSLRSESKMEYFKTHTLRNNPTKV